MLRTLIVGCLWFGMAAALQAADVIPADDSRVKFFEEKVRPILVEHCQQCHGAKKQQADLRLDSLEGALKGGEHGPALVPGDADKSLLISAVLRTGDYEMPPDKPLAEAQIASLTTWVKQGAVWPGKAEVIVTPTSPAGFERARREHWAFQPVRQPPLPALKNAAWVSTPVDSFILAKLEAQGLAPAPAADKRTLFRRITFDLTGLPPTYAEVQAFEADTAPDAYARVVERLLAAPQYGERWGRYWLDVARYSDTKGYVFFEDGAFPWAWTYRDYVIEAFNQDVPYDRFLLEQLAADRLPLGDQRRALRGLGFLTLGGRFMNNPHDIIDDRIDVVTRGLQGLTVSCARCHDHKFDALPTADYYSLYGIFASSSEPIVPPLYDPAPDTDEYRKFEAELRARETKLKEFVQTKQGAVIEGTKTRVAEYMLTAHATRDQPRTDDFMLVADGGDLNPKMLRRWQSYLEEGSKSHHRVLAVWTACGQLPEAEFAAQATALIATFAAEPNPALAVNPLVIKALQDKPPQKLADVAAIYSELLNGVEKEWQGLVQQATAASQPAPSGLPDADKEDLRRVFHAANSPTNVPTNVIGDLELLPDRASQNVFRELRKAIETFRSAGPAAPPRAMTLEDSPVPVEPRIFKRGSAINQGDAVPRQYLQIISGPQRQPFHAGSGRLELAQAIVDRSNPLTARVLVNRIWLHHFGSGLVRTPSDFGVRSDPPSHPELLDALAASFMEHGWSIKNLHRQIVLSNTYQQASADRPECQAVDSENRLLWKFNRQRLDLEALRDALLSTSGRLDLKLGGPSINMLAVPAVPRRTVYASIDRLALPSLFRTFDFPSPDTTTPQRDTTTVAPQALFMMNHPFALESAQYLIARREVAGAADFATKVTKLYELVLSRGPSEGEHKFAEEFFTGLDQKIQETPENWTMFAHALLMTNEFAFID
ncbi:MAG: Planctomycete cytochrome [Planctomycetaceae bacterium]|nr:Planctomycete cytochrome [Planctomycetaceae bacterium]